MLQYVKLYKLSKFFNNSNMLINNYNMTLVYGFLCLVIFNADIDLQLYEDIFQRIILLSFVIYVTYVTPLCMSWRCSVHDEKRFCLSIPTLTPLQSVDNYFVYVISDLISTFADPAEYLRYGETVSTRSRLKQKRSFISRHAQTQFIHAIYELCSGLITLTSWC